MQLPIRFNSGRDYAIAGVVFATVVLALMYSAVSIRTTISSAIG